MESKKKKKKKEEDPYFKKCTKTLIKFEKPFKNALKPEQIVKHRKSIKS